MRPVVRSRILRYLALASVVLALSVAPVRAQSSAPVPDKKTVRLVESALERAARVWGEAGVVDGAAGEARAVVWDAPLVAERLLDTFMGRPNEAVVRYQVRFKEDWED